MSKTTWEQSVEKARLASLRTFEGRLEIARASFEQIPPKGKGATHTYTLADFAGEIGIEYDALRQYRGFSVWWGDCAPQSTISYTLAREAKESGKWKTGKAFVAFTLREDPPLYDSDDEYEPYQFTAWTMNALRVHLGRKPNNNLNLVLKEKAGETVTEDDLHDAAAGDAMETVAGEVEQIKEPKRKKKRASKVLSEALDVTATTHDGPEIIEEIVLPALYHLPGDIDRAKRELLALVEQAPDFLDRYGREPVSKNDETTMADVMVQTLQQVKGDVSVACDRITGDLDAALDEILANS